MKDAPFRASLAAIALLLTCCSKQREVSVPSAGTAAHSAPKPAALAASPRSAQISVDSPLPPLPRLASVTTSVDGDSVDISVEPVSGARDYRVYVLPDAADVLANADGSVVIKNATYRCAGDRQSRPVATDNSPFGPGEGVLTQVDNVEIAGFTRQLADATLGYVYVTPGADRSPVYALGDPARDADNSCFHQRWRESRVKRYVTSEGERRELIAKRWRDDGVAFYVPSECAAGRAVFTSGGNAPLYFGEGPERARRGAGTRAFCVLAKPPATPNLEVVPLMRLYLKNACGNGHDELVAGMPRFERARTQGDRQPLFDLHWSGITGETTLVVEALSQGCPFQGVLAPVSRAASKDDGVDYPPFSTLADVRAGSPHGEVFVNGQHDAANRPRAIARSFVKVAPGPKPDLDWFSGFGPGDAVPDFMAGRFDAPCESPGNPNCLHEYRQTSAFGDISFGSTTPNRNGIAAVLGELWVIYADVGADVGGKFRFTAPVRGKMSETSYLRVTMAVDAFTTARRYPQIIVSDGAAPVQWRLEKSKSIIIQTFTDQGTANWPYAYQLQLCDHRTWDVNNQCPTADLYRLGDSNNPTALAAAPEVAELTGVDRSTPFEAFLSTTRAYLFLGRKPYACLNLPAKSVPSGAVTVTFGDVLYHSGADHVMAFHEKHQKLFAKRHFDNLGFKSGVPAPAWDEANMPCFPASAIK
jgi:hypothetical protein